MLLKSQLATLNGSLKVILASQSPRRQELLRQVGVSNFKVIVSNFAEDLDKKQFSSAADYCKATARGKATDMLSRLETEKEPWDVIICADTIVVDTDTTTGKFEIIEKAPDAEAAFHMIKKLQGKQHEVITVLLVVFGSKVTGKSEPVMEVHAEHVGVKLAPLSDELIREYTQNEPAWRGKAGAYGVQDAAATFIEGVFGDYYTVMGLPVHQLSKMLASKIPQ